MRQFMADYSIHTSSFPDGLIHVFICITTVSRERMSFQGSTLLPNHSGNSSQPLILGVFGIAMALKVPVDDRLAPRVNFVIPNGPGCV